MSNGALVAHTASCSTRFQSWCVSSQSESQSEAPHANYQICRSLHRFLFRSRFHREAHMSHNQNPVFKWSTQKTCTELRRRPPLFWLDCPLVTFIYPGFDSGSFSCSKLFSLAPRGTCLPFGRKLREARGTSHLPHSDVVTQG